MTDMGSLKFVIAQEEDNEDICRLFGETFHHSEPILRACKLTTDEIAERVGTFSLGCITSQLSLITETIDSVTHQRRIIGACIIGEFTDHNDPKSNDFINRHPQFGKVMEYCDKMNNHFKDTYKISDLSKDKGKYCSLLYLAVHPEFSGKGIGTRLCKAAMSHVIDGKGYEVVSVDTSSLFSDRILSKLGFEEVLTFRYSDLADNEPMFQQCLDEGHYAYKLLIFDKFKYQYHKT